ncbi:MAG: ClbS/DfsB family four-helix bundle protein [Thermoflexales bacterium]|nr:ClbS/DfsB family four-helix bundle protein [Thermoflexales bacterium]
MDIKSKLIELTEQAHEEERKFVASLSDEERSAAGAPDRWSAKDTFAHCVEWQVRTAHRLGVARRDETPPAYDGDIDELNAEIFALYRNQSWDEVLQAGERARREIVEHIQAATADELSDPQRFAWLQGRPLWKDIVGNTYIHPVSHLAALYAERGQAEAAIQLQEAAARALAALDESPSWQGTVTYNLACGYALAGDKDQAIACLGEALKARPDLVEWSKQDPDFASIREEPAYQALYS